MINFLNCLIVLLRVTMILTFLTPYKKLLYYDKFLPQITRVVGTVRALFTPE